MKITLLSLLILLSGISCQTNPCKMTADEFEVKGSYLGKVHLSMKEACPVYVSIEGVFSKSSIVDFHTIYPINLEKEFKKDITNLPNKSLRKHPNINRSVLVELMIRIAKSKNDESIDSICQMVAEESGIQGNETNTAGELLRKGMEDFQSRSKVKRNKQP